MFRDTCTLWWKFNFEYSGAIKVDDNGMSLRHQHQQRPIIHGVFTPHQTNAAPTVVAPFDGGHAVSYPPQPTPSVMNVTGHVTFF